MAVSLAASKCRSGGARPVSRDHDREEMPASADLAGADSDERSEDDPLVRRLRGLEWPKVSDDVRERCWRGLTEKLADSGAPEWQVSCALAGSQDATCSS